MHGTRWSFPTAFSSWGVEEANAIDRVISSQYFTMGEEVEAFEEEFASYHRMKYGIMVNSGSSANLVMVAALFASRRLPPRISGNSALVPALAWSTTYAPLVQHDLRLRLMDCDNEGTWGCELPDVGDAKLVIGCSVLGNPAPLEFLRTAADANGAIFLEDNCESLGAFLGEERCGTFGLMNSFSFFHSHQISAIEGGMILTNDKEMARMCRILRAHGWTRDVEAPWSFDTEYNFTHFGYNVRPLELHAAIARCQLRKLNEFVENRRRNLALFTDLTKDANIRLQKVRGMEPSPFGLAFTVSTPEVRRTLAGKLREQGVDCRLPTGGSFRKHPYGRAWAHQATPNADKIHDTGMFLGNAPWIIEDKISVAAKVIREVCGGKESG